MVEGRIVPQQAASRSPVGRFWLLGGWYRHSASAVGAPARGPLPRVSATLPDSPARFPSRHDSDVDALELAPGVIKCHLPVHATPSHSVTRPSVRRPRRRRHIMQLNPLSGMFSQVPRCDVQSNSLRRKSDRAAFRGQGSGSVPLACAGIHSTARNPRPWEVAWRTSGSSSGDWPSRPASPY